MLSKGRTQKGGGRRMHHLGRKDYVGDYSLSVTNRCLDAFPAKHSSALQETRAPVVTACLGVALDCENCINEVKVASLSCDAQTALLALASCLCNMCPWSQGDPGRACAFGSAQTHHC